MESPKSYSWANFRPLHIAKFICLLMAAVASLAPATVRAQAQAIAQLQSNKGFVGTPVVLQIQILSGSDTIVEGEPTFAVDGLSVNGPYSGAMMNINGSKRMASPIRYEIVPQRAGTFTIPAISLTVAGQVISTQPLELTVTEPQAADTSPLLQLRVQKNELWEGEEGVMEIAFLIPQQCQINEIPFPTLSRSGFAMKRFTREARQSMREFNGAIYREFVFQTTFYGMKSGKLALGPAEAKGEVFIPSGRQQRTPFGLGMQNSEPRKFQISSNEVEITVKPLPAEGRPEGFHGAVGQFTVSVQAQPNRVNQGDPLTALLIVQGQGNYETVEAPVLENADGWRAYESRVVQENRNGNENGAIVYSQILEPQALHKFIPPYVLHYFDPVQQKYVSARSAEVPISVLPSKALANGTLPGGNGTTGVRDFGNTAMPLPNEQLAGLLGMLPTMGTLQPLGAAGVSSLLGRTWLLHGPPLAILLTMLGVAYARRRASKAKVAKQAISEVRPTDVLRELRGSAAHLSPQAFYAKAAQFLDVWEAANHRSAPDTALAEKIRLRRDFYCYSQSVEGSTVPAGETSELLSGLDRF